MSFSIVKSLRRLDVGFVGCVEAMVATWVVQPVCISGSLGWGFCSEEGVVEGSLTGQRPTERRPRVRSVDERQTAHWLMWKLTYAVAVGEASSSRFDATDIKICAASTTLKSGSAGLGLSFYDHAYLCLSGGIDIDWVAADMCAISP